MLLWFSSSQFYPRLGPWFNIKMSSYQYWISHCGDKTVVRSYLHNGISYTGKMSSLYWIGGLFGYIIVPLAIIFECNFSKPHRHLVGYGVTVRTRSHWFQKKRYLLIYMNLVSISHLRVIFKIAFNHMFHHKPLYSAEIVELLFWGFPDPGVSKSFKRRKYTGKDC